MHCELSNFLLLCEGKVLFSARIIFSLKTCFLCVLGAGESFAIISEEVWFLCVERCPLSVECYQNIARTKLQNNWQQKPIKFELDRTSRLGWVPHLHFSPSQQCIFCWVFSISSKLHHNLPNYSEFPIILLSNVVCSSCYLLQFCRSYLPEQILSYSLIV